MAEVPPGPSQEQQVVDILRVLQQQLGALNSTITLFLRTVAPQQPDKEPRKTFGGGDSDQVVKELVRRSKRAGTK